MRSEVQKLLELGAFPSSTDVDLKTIPLQEELIAAIQPPLTEAEGRALVGLFGPDDYFGLAWSLLHLIESVPSIIPTLPQGADNEWIRRLRRSAGLPS